MDDFKQKRKKADPQPFPSTSSHLDGQASEDIRNTQANLLIRNNLPTGERQTQNRSRRQGEDSEHSRLYVESGQTSANTSSQESANQTTRLLDSERSCCCCGNLSKIMPESARLMSAYFVAELIGTFLLVIIGDGAIAAYVLNKREIDLFSACFAFGVGAMIATFVAAKISGAHINPAASLAFALNGQLRWRLVPVYICAQYLGGFLAALLLYVNYNEAIDSLDGGRHSSFGSANSTGHIFATYPGPWVSVWGSLLDQIVGTALLLFSLCAVTDKNNAGLEDRHQPIIIAFVIGLICLAFSPNCGAILNPARDLAPRLVTSILGYSAPSVWSPVQGVYWLVAGVVGPHLGAILGVFAYKGLIGRALRTKRHFDEPGSPMDTSDKYQVQQHQLQAKFAQTQH